MSELAFDLPGSRGHFQDRLRLLSDRIGLGLTYGMLGAGALVMIAPFQPFV